MKKYTTPNMNISIFSDPVEMSASAEPQQYVGALKTIDDKKQVNLSDVRDITGFVF